MRGSIRSERVKLPRVHRVTRRGKVYKYHRVTRNELPNDVPEDHPRFIAAWTAEEAGKPRATTRAKPGTFAAGCAEYLASRSYRDLSDSYRPVIRRHVEAIGKQGGAAKMSDLRPRHIEADMEPLSPAVARSRLKAWRKLCPFWRGKGYIATDVSRDVRGKKMPRTDGHKEWAAPDLAQFRTRWHVGTPQRLAGELLQWSGARCIDLVRLGPAMVKNGDLHFTQRKTGGEVYIPWGYAPSGLTADHAHLVAALDAIEARHMVYLTTVHGKPRSHKAVSSWFSQAASEAGLESLTAHGLRKYRMNALAEAGKTVLQMQSWVGHVTLAEVESYTRRANRRAAFAAERKENPVKHP